MTIEMLTTSQVCERAQVTRQTIARWVRMGLMPAPVRLGPRALRFRKSDIEGWLSSGGVRLHQSGLMPSLSAWIPDEPMVDAETLAAIDESA